MFSYALTNASCARSSASSGLRTMPHATEMTRLRYFETRYSYASGRPAFVSAIAATSNASSSCAAAAFNRTSVELLIVHDPALTSDERRDRPETARPWRADRE